jgi:hypothetical protein
MSENIIVIVIYVALIVIVPLIPAIIIFRLFPGTRVFVKGPFKGLSVRFAGAFAGYFIIVIVVSGVVTSYYLNESKKPDQYDLWTVEGRIQYENPSERTLYSNVIISIIPPEQDKNPVSGGFTLNNVPIKNIVGQRKSSLIFYLKNYHLETVHVGADDSTKFSQDFDISRNIFNKKIEINKPVILKPEITDLRQQSDVLLNTDKN